MLIEDLKELPVFPFAAEFPHLSEDEQTELAQDLELNGQRHPIILFTMGEDALADLEMVAKESSTPEALLMAIKELRAALSPLGTVTTILDGRNRLKALQQTNLTDALVEYFEGDVFQAVDLIMTLNIHRRHMDRGQKGGVARSYLPYEKVNAGKRLQEAQEKGRETQKAQRSGEWSPEDPPESTEKPKKDRSRESRELAGSKAGVDGRAVSDMETLSLNAPDLYAEVMKGNKEGMALDAAMKELKRRQEDQHVRLLFLERDQYRSFLKQYESAELSLDEAYVAARQHEAAEKRRFAEANPPAMVDFVNRTETFVTWLREFNGGVVKFKTPELVDRGFDLINTIENELITTKRTLGIKRDELEEGAE